MQDSLAGDLNHVSSLQLAGEVLTILQADTHHTIGKSYQRLHSNVTKFHVWESQIRPGGRNVTESRDEISQERLIVFEYFSWRKYLCSCAGNS